MVYLFILLVDLKACCCSNTAEACLLRFMEAQNVKNLSDPWLRRHQNQRLTEPSVVFFLMGWEMPRSSPSLSFYGNFSRFM
ncbi:unnamed protein product [Brassica oleracea var. botrytis]